MKERLLKYAKYAGYVGYPLFYVFCLLFFAILCIPYDKLKERFIASYNEEVRAAGGQRELQIDEMTGYWVTGVAMKGVRLLSAPSEAGKPIAKLEIDEATVRFGASDVTFDATGFGGEASGTLEHQGNDKAIDVTFGSIDLSKIEPLANGFANMIREALRPLRAVEGGAEPPPVPINAKVAGTLRLAMPGGSVSKATGAISLELKDAGIGDGNPKSMGGLALPRIDIGTINVAGDVKEGVLKLTKLIAGGKDLDLQGEGRVTLREVVTDSLCDVGLRFRLSDAYRGKSDVTRSLFGASGSSAPTLFELADPRIKQAKRPDGFYSWSMRGPLDRLAFIPAGGASMGLPGGLPGVGM